MNNKWSKAEKITNNTYAVVVACSALTVHGVANGRTIPVAFVENDNENKIAPTINYHKNQKQGICTTQWGITEDKKYALLFLGFSIPTETPIVLFFDILKYGHVVTHIIKMRCLYLAIGTKDSKLSENLDCPKVLIEIKNDDFLEEWNKIFKKEYTKLLRKEFKLSQKDANDIFDKITEKVSIIEKIRL